MMTMRLKFLAALLAALALGSLVCAPQSGAVMMPTVLEVSGIFEGIDASLEPPVITLNVNKQSVSGPLSSVCQFMDARGNQITQEDFVKRYLGRHVTLELYEDSGEVISGKASQ